MAAELAPLLARLEQRRAALEANIFQFPPSDWPEFQRRLGAWQELEGHIIEVKQELEEKDEL